jgi:hypothetical protein
LVADDGQLRYLPRLELSRRIHNKRHRQRIAGLN